MSDEVDVIVIDGTPYPRVRFGEERHRDESPCPGCGAYYFDVHAIGCDYEQCPRCSGLLATCGCAGAPEAG